jgi:hypothetical protein
VPKNLASSLVRQLVSFELSTGMFVFTLEATLALREPQLDNRVIAEMIKRLLIDLVVFVLFI